MKTLKSVPVTLSQERMIAEIGTFLVFVSRKNPQATVLVDGEERQMLVHDRMICLPISIEQRPHVAYIAITEQDSEPFLVNKSFGRIELLHYPVLKSVHIGLAIWLSKANNRPLSQIFVIDTGQFTSKDPEFLEEVFALAERVISLQPELKKSKILGDTLLVSADDGYYVISPSDRRIFVGDSENQNTWRMLVDFDEKQFVDIVKEIRSWLPKQKVIRFQKTPDLWKGKLK